MHDADAMRGRQAAAICLAMGRTSAVVNRPVSMKPLGQRLAGQQLHGEKDDLVPGA